MAKLLPGSYQGFQASTGNLVIFKVLKAYPDNHYDIEVNDLTYSYITLDELELIDVKEVSNGKD